MPSLLECILWASGDTPASCTVGLPRRAPSSSCTPSRSCTAAPRRPRDGAAAPSSAPPAPAPNREGAQPRRSSMHRLTSSTRQRFSRGGARSRLTRLLPAPPTAVSAAASSTCGRGPATLSPASATGQRKGNGVEGAPLELVVWSASVGPRAAPAVVGAAPATSRGEGMGFICLCLCVCWRSAFLPCEGKYCAQGKIPNGSLILSSLVGLSLNYSTLRFFDPAARIDPAASVGWLLRKEIELPFWLLHLLIDLTDALM
jgi:hypothetical protein